MASGSISTISPRSAKSLEAGSMRACLEPADTIGREMLVEVVGRTGDIEIGTTASNDSSE